MNKVGRVVKVEGDGDLRVDFNGRQYLYAPACCLPATGRDVDSIGGDDAPSGADESEISNPADQADGDHSFLITIIIIIIIVMMMMMMIITIKNNIDNKDDDDDDTDEDDDNNSNKDDDDNNNNNNNNNITIMR